ncbi:hypothetical protein AX17_006965 [Amanita inopinata Kibby_2008]|nr:hypothetical protein AX17_006965 [Amanita inopinata Kibby_2008]
MSIAGSIANVWRGLYVTVRGFKRNQSSSSKLASSTAVEDHPTMHLDTPSDRGLCHWSVSVGFECEENEDLLLDFPRQDSAQQNSFYATVVTTSSGTLRLVKSLWLRLNV